MPSLFKSIVSFPYYYWKYRLELWESFLDEIPFVHRPEQSKEIWCLENKSKLKDVWVVKLPQRCITCGKWGPYQTEDQARLVDDYSSPALTAFLGLTTGSLAGRYYSLWSLPVAIVLGMFFGYLFKQESQVRITFFRCPNHLGDRQYPRLRVFGKHLIVRVGDEAVRKDFREPDAPPI